MSYVPYTQYHHRCAVYERVMRKGFQSYLPLALVRQKSKRGLRQVATPLFPRYAFVCRDFEMYTHLELINTPGVIQLQEGSRGRSLIVPDEEIQLLRQLGDSDSPLRHRAYSFRQQMCRSHRASCAGFISSFGRKLGRPCWFQFTRCKPAYLWKSARRRSCRASTWRKSGARVVFPKPGGLVIMLQQEYGTPSPFRDKGVMPDHAAIDHRDLAAPIAIWLR